MPRRTERRLRAGGWARSAAAGLTLIVTVGGTARAEVEIPTIPSFAAEPELRKKLEEALAEYALLQKEIADEKVWLAEQLNKLEGQRLDARDRFEKAKRALDDRRLEQSGLREDIAAREKERDYLSSMFDEYVRNWETRLHIAELPRYEDEIEDARLVLQDADRNIAEKFSTQLIAIRRSIDRLEDMMGGARFPGQAAGRDGLVKQGEFLMVGPVAYFRSEDGSLAGIAETKIGSLEPSVAGFSDPSLAALAAELVRDGEGLMPLDTSLGNARKVEETEQTLVEHIAKGGIVMYPILGMFSAAMLVSLYKLIRLSLVRMPGRQAAANLLKAAQAGDRIRLKKAVKAIPGPAGDMLRAGFEHYDDPKDLVEEVMFERMLGTKYKLMSLLPFIAVSAASAPLLGLLGTVTGIINTFKLLTVFGTGDVKMLSSGISEALITTEFGLIVAIPSLLFHAFLSRKAQALVEAMEQLALSYLSAIEKARTRPARAAVAAAAEGNGTAIEVAHARMVEAFELIEKIRREETVR